MVPSGKNKSHFAILSDEAGNRLPFVSFALLILVVGPIITGALINAHEGQLLEAVQATRMQLQQVRTIVQVPRNRRPASTVPASVRSYRDSLDASLTAAEEAQKRAAQRVADLHSIQDGVIASFGLLGMIAAFYSVRAVHQLRQLAATNGRRARALESLFDTAGHLSVSASPASMHEFLTERAGRVLQARRVEMWSYDAARNLLSPLRPAFGFGKEAPPPLSVQSDKWTHDLLFQNEAICRNSIPQTGGDALAQQLRAWGAQNALLVPLVAHNQPFGLLCAYDKVWEDTFPKKPQTNQPAAPRAFTDDDAQLLRTFATQAAFVLHSARQYAQARDRGEHLAALARLTQVVNTSLELEIIVPAFLREAQALVPYTRARLALRPVETEGEGWSQEYPEQDAEETDLLRLLRGKARAGTSFPSTVQQKATLNADTSHGTFSSPRAGEKLPINHAYVWTVEVGKSEPIAEEHGAQWQILASEDPILTTMQTGHAHRDGHLAIPLIAHGEILGALVFETYAEETPPIQAGNSTEYTEHHLLLARQAAGQLATAVQNARLYQKAMHRAEQLEFSMQETQHRIKNNLQAVTAILDLYLMETKGSSRASYSPEEAGKHETIARDGLAHAMREVSTISAVHDLISKDAHLNRVDASELLDTLTEQLLSGPLTAGKRLDLNVHADDLRLPSKLASALALAFSELIVNAVRHGGRERSEITLHITLHQKPERLCLTVEDDGPGFPANFDPRKHAHIGLDLARIMIERDLKGALEFVNNEHTGGATVTARVPYKETFSQLGSFNH